MESSDTTAPPNAKSAGARTPSEASAPAAPPFSVAGSKKGWLPEEAWKWLNKKMEDKRLAAAR